ncbi:NAD(P)-dependent oxidoreductase [Lacticaseibacillus daqingensis]|uniref:NAD(P)-dependent oxidoreductase n=1 Tax=Lacticaseibacillus daqingensis TaxID=2486014 RepID=UPI000F772AC0|nr:NAD(P)H-binding protein [Lacticaseibacillus daqingensis]
MKIAIIGATGTAGRAITQEALNRGHQVTGVVRHPEVATDLFDRPVTMHRQDAFTLTRAQLRDFDVVIDAFRPANDQAYLHLDLAAHLIHELRETETPRLVFITGAASLAHPAGGLLYDRLVQLPNHEEWIATPQNQALELDFLRHVTNVNWLAFSPSATFQAGPATDYVRGTDTLLQDSGRQSVLSSGNLALALLDELAHPTLHQARMTARNR